MVADAITRLIVSIQFDILSEIELLLNNPIVYLLVLAALLLFGEKRKMKRIRIALTMIVALVLGLIVNVGMAVERPCSDIAGALCPMLFSFPSIHCTMAFILMISFMNKKEFPAFLLFALFIAFSRLNLGVHVFRDVAGALIIALLAYNITYIFWRRWVNG